MESLSVADGLAFRGERVGKYEVLTRLSVGGMAELFLAFTSGPGGFRKYVVLKRILPEVRSDDSFVKMFLDEARITAALNHPNIAQVFDLGDSEAGLYLAMEFIAGRNLNQITSAHLKRRSLLPVGFCTAVARDVCLALHYAHTFTDPLGRPAPVIHRDVAQKNVMVTYDGVTKLLDFGIAKAKGSLGQTRVGMVKGTTGYMSPEQVQAQPLDGRSDVFSMGVMLYELVTGRRLFSAATEEEEMRKILSAPVPPPRAVAPQVPEALEGVILKALQRNRDERFASARDMARALEEVMDRGMYDQEQVGGFMRTLFSKKMAATRSLFESAESEEKEGLENSVVRVFRDDDSTDAREGQTREPSPPPPRKPDPREERIVREEPPTPSVELPAGGRWDSKENLSSPQTGPLMENLHRARLQRAFTGALVALLVVGGVGVFLYRNAEEAVHKPAPAPAAKSPVPLVAEEARPVPREPPPEPARRAPPPTPAEPKAATGTLTLVTKPSCEVRLNHHRVGRTPLFNAVLPAGKHTLELRGRGGLVTRLRVNIVAGRNTAMRLELGALR